MDLERRRANRLALITAVYQATGGPTGITIDLNYLHASAELSIADVVGAGYKVDPPELPVEGIVA